MIAPNRLYRPIEWQAREEYLNAGNEKWQALRWDNSDAPEWEASVGALRAIFDLDTDFETPPEARRRACCVCGKPVRGHSFTDDGVQVKHHRCPQ